ncbi:MAG: PaaI family thioesterase [Alphaproteobacteria bacterium]
MSDNLNAHIDRIPFAKLLGIEVISVADDRIEAKLTVKPEHCNPMGGLHGGAAISIADTLGAMCAFRNLPEGANGTTTLESKTNFLGPAKSGDTVIAVCTPIHVGRRTSVWQTKLTTEAGKSVALVIQTQMTL